MDTLSLVEFPDTEEAFSAWRRRFPSGFVINAWKRSDNKPDSTRSITWHRADCEHLGSGGTERYVTGDTMKACSTNAAALAIWARSRSEPLTYCTDCHRAWLKEENSD